MDSYSSLPFSKTIFSLCGSRSLLVFWILGWAALTALHVLRVHSFFLRIRAASDPFRICKSYLSVYGVDHYFLFDFPYANSTHSILPGTQSSLSDLSIKSLVYRNKTLPTSPLRSAYYLKLFGAESVPTRFQTYLTLPNFQHLRHFAFSQPSRIPRPRPNYISYKSVDYTLGYSGSVNAHKKRGDCYCAFYHH